MAAALRGSPDFMLDCAIKGTRNIAAAARAQDLKRVIYISSMSVYDSLKLSDGGIISEESPLEECPKLRGTYSLAKRRAEDEALAHLRDTRPQWTILRPSVIVGERYDLFSPVGNKTGSFLFCAGSRDRILSLVHVEDVALALIKLIPNSTGASRVFNLSAESVTQKAYVEQFIRQAGYHNLRVLYIPYWMVRCVAGVLAMLRRFSRRIPEVSNRRLASLYRSTCVSTEAIRNETGWQPRQNLLDVLLAEAEGSNVRTAKPKFSEGIQVAASVRDSGTAL